MDEILRMREMNLNLCILEILEDNLSLNAAQKIQVDISNEARLIDRPETQTS